ncbi:MAG: tetratricopeptide repeat protein [Verrucomicrobia bacterium]|nr:tetratricopeptide repeat protein [Verrucomicrobiota bacterium]
MVEGKNKSDDAQKESSRKASRDSREEGSSKTSVYGGREHYVSLEHELGKRRQSTSGSRHSSRHRKSRRRTQSLPLGVKLLWAGLTIVLAAYVGMLGYSRFKASQDAAERDAEIRRKSEEPKTASKEIASPDSEETSDPDLNGLQARILDWKNSYEKIGSAQDLQKNGETDRAIERLESALSTTPAHIGTKLALAKIYMEEKESERAMKLLIEVMDADPLNAKARLALATLLSETGDHDSALDLAKWIIETDAYSVEAHRIASTAYLKTDRVRAAIPHLQKLMNLQRDNIVEMNHLATAYSQLREFGKAIKVFNDILSRDPDSSVTYYNLAVCYAQQDIPSQTVDVLNRAVKKFGAGFVGTWVQSKDFDPVREDAAFSALENEVLGNTPSTAPDA